VGKENRLILGTFETRRLAVMFAGFCAFLQLYATQPLLPMLENLFRASKVAVSLTVTAGGFGVALGAPIVGYMADRLGRKQLIVWSATLLALSTFLTATASSLNVLIFWRFWQGVFTPGVFAVTIAYVNDEWADGGAAAVLSTYVSGTVLGGFSSRMISGLVASRLSWQWVFVVLGTMGGLGAWGIARWLPPERSFHHLTVEKGSWFEAVREHVANRQLLAAFAIGFCVLFSLVSTFTYVTFYLAEPPFHLESAALGLVFAVYLAGAVVTPFSGRTIDRYGNRRALAGAISFGAAGVALTLGKNLWLVGIGLAIACSGVFLAQASANAFVGASARRNRALAAGLYAAAYHAGGSFGAAVPGYFWALGGWPACVAFIIAVQALTVVLALAMWQDRPNLTGSVAWANPPEID
jgi:YNFM family putative membrane transporter